MWRNHSCYLQVFYYRMIHERISTPAIHHGLEAAVGNTPLVRLARVSHGLAPGVEVLAKAEWFNPSGSIKDRPALNILRQALAGGKLPSGRRLLDSTSGNMGIAYATFGAAFGIPVSLALPGNASPERIRILRLLGAVLHITDPLEGSDGAIHLARQLAEVDPVKYFYANQYGNPANPESHYLATGPEIFAQTDGAVTHFVAGLGTSGTLMGTGRYLRKANPAVEIVAFQPSTPFHGLEGLKHIPTSIRPEIFDPDLADRTLEISTEDAQEMTLRLAREEGLFVGVSSGAAALAALKVAADLEHGTVVTVFPDAGYKYLSEKFWGGPG
jgi:cysteine synthase B